MPRYRVSQLQMSCDMFETDAENPDEALRICHDSDPHDERWNFDPGAELIHEIVEIVLDTQLPLEINR